MKSEFFSTIASRIRSQVAGLAVLGAAFTGLAWGGIESAPGLEMGDPGSGLVLSLEQEQQQEKKETQVSGQDGQTGSAVDPVTGKQSTGAEKDKPVWPQTEDGWFLVTPEGANASFEVPVEPEASSRNMVSGENKKPITIHLNVAVDKAGTNLVFAWHDQVAPKNNDEIAKILDGTVKGALAMTLGELELAEPTRLGQIPACNFRIRFVFGETPMKLSSLAILHQERVFQLTYVATEEQYNEADQKRFLDSFKYLQPPPKPDPAKSEQDK